MPERRAPPEAASAFRALLLLLVVTLLQGCETTVVTPVEVDRVEVVPSDVTLVEGERATFSAVLRNAGGDELGAGRVTWSTDDPNVALVSSDGVVDALSRGSTRIRASVADVSGTAALRVLLGPTLQLSTDEVSFEATADDVETRVAEIDIENGGAGALEGLEVRAEDSSGASPSWLAAALLASAAPTRLELRADPAGLEPGTYEARLTIASSSAEEDAEVDVSLRIRDRDEDDEDDDERGSVCGISGNFVSGDLRIPRDTRCVIDDLHVAGNLRLDEGASLVGSHVRVTGNVEGREAEELTLTDAAIFGDLRFEDGGSLTLRESSVAGKVEIKSNVGSIELQDNVIEDDVKLEKNRGGPFSLVRNTIDDKLDCKENDPPPAGAGNVADEKTGQCRAL